MLKIQKLKSYGILWDEVCCGISNQLKTLIGKDVDCKAAIDETDFWGVRLSARLGIDEIQQLCISVGATDQELAEALPYDGEDSVDSFGGSLVNKILSRELGIKWDLFYADQDRLILIGCRTIK